METIRKDGKGRTALITGASAGIGRELALVFAGHGFDVVLMARNGRDAKGKVRGL